MSADAVDYLKFAAARIFFCESEFRALHDGVDPPIVETVRARLIDSHAEPRDAARRVMASPRPTPLEAKRFRHLAVAIR